MTRAIACFCGQLIDVPVWRTAAAAHLTTRPARDRLLGPRYRLGLTLGRPF